MIRRLQSLVPYWGDGTPSVVAIRTLRMAALLVAICTPLYGLVYRATAPDAIDPMWARAGLVLVALALLIASYVVPRVRAQPRPALAALLVAVVIWSGALTLVNNLNGEYVLGFMFVVISAAMGGSLVWDRSGPLNLLLATACAIGVAGALLVEPTLSKINPLTFGLVVLSSAVIVCCGFYGRLRTANALRRSERQLADAERMAKTGAWTFDLARSRRRWSAGMYDILGIDPSDRDSVLMDFVVHEDRALCDAEHERMRRDGVVSDMQFRIVRADGEQRWVRSRAEMVFDKNRQPVQLRGVLRDITDQVIRELALEQARDEALAATRAQSEFLANMSHEIRTPLTAIIGFAEMLREEVDDSTLVEPIATGGRRLLDTLNSVLDLARMEADQEELTLSPQDLVAEVREVGALLWPKASSKGLALDLDLPPEPVGVLADGAALGRVLANLLSNAIKFTDSGGVTVRVRTDEDDAVLDVVDTGCGMSAAFLNDLFEPFRQASTGWSRSHEGTGLGMTITKGLVEAMGGCIEVQSALHEGTQMTVRLQRVAAATSDGAAQPVPHLVCATS